MLQGLEKGKWAKDYAYGTSPNLGNSHYFFMNNIKFLEGPIDPKGNKLRGHVIPHTPHFCEKPKKPYYSWQGKYFYYNFEKDPLGVQELFYRGDMAYKFKDSKYEWKSEKVKDTMILERFKEAAYSIASESKKLGEVFKEGSKGVQKKLTEEELKQLGELGYGGMIAVSRMNASKSGNNTSGASNLKKSVDLIDRTLLNQGDEFLWDLSYYHRKGESMDQEEFNTRHPKAREAFNAFLKQNPNKANLVTWRIKFIDNAITVYSEKQKK